MIKILELKLFLKEKSCSADANLGVKDNGVSAGASLSLLSAGIDVSIKAFGKQVTFGAEGQIGAIGAGGNIYFSEFSLGVNAAAGVGGALKFKYDGDGQDFDEKKTSKPQKKEME